MSRQSLAKSLDLRPVLDLKLAALASPLDQKEPGSEAWIIQMTAKAVRIWMSLDDDTKQWRDAVAKLDAQKVWEKYPPEKPYGTRDAFYRAELGAPEPMLTQLKETQQAIVRAKAGRPKKGDENNSGNARIKLVGRDNDAAYIRARLERDGKTELLARVDAGQISAHAAAIEAGFRKRMVQVEPTREGLLRAARKHLSEAEQHELKEAL